MEIESVCVYCGCGCKLVYVVENGRIKKVLPCKSDKVSLGKPCIKGLTISEVVDEGRILKPYVRSGNRLKEISWEKALDKIYKKLKKASSQEVMLVGSGKITNEDNFVIQKFGRLVLETNNIDNCCARLCHAATVMGFKDNLGIGAVPHFIDDIIKCDCLFIIGSNPASNYPIIFNRILEMKKRGGKVITVAPLFSETSEISDLHIKIFPGTEVALFNCIINLLIEKNAIRKDAKSIKNFNELKRKVRKYDPKTVSEICKVKENVLIEAAEIIAKSKNFGVMHGMGITQHVNAIENVHSLCNLVILKKGKVFSGRGEINVQGAGDMFVAPSLIQFSSAINRRNAKKIWKKDLPVGRGMNIVEAFCLGQAKIALISGFNPAHSLPNLTVVHRNLRKMFLVQMESYFNLTSRFADLILPTPILIERTGTITNGERMVRFVRKVREPLGESLAEWKIYCKLAKLFGAEGFDYQNEFEIFQEIVKIVKAYSHLNPKDVYSGKDVYADKRIKFERFYPEEFEGVEEIRSKRYPFILFTFRSRYFFLSNEMTGKSKTLSKMPDGPFFYINKDDAKELGIKDGDRIKVKSKVSYLIGKAKIDKRIPKGFVGAHFHFEKLLINKLFPLQFDEESFTPNFKTVAVKILKL